MDIFTDVDGVLGSTVRLHSIRMKDYRNIEDSTIVFPNSKLSDIESGNPSILGLYGQNGSGKTSVIMALGLLKRILSGDPLDSKYASCIRKGAERATLFFELCGANNQLLNNNADIDEVLAFYNASLEYSRFEVCYQFDLVSVLNNDNNVVQIENEQLSLKIIDKFGNVIVPKQVFIDCRESACKAKLQAFGSRSKFKMLVGDDKAVQSELYIAKAVAKAQSRSFVFSPEFISIIYAEFTKRVEKNKDLANKMVALTVDAISMLDSSETSIVNSSSDDLVNEVRKVVAVATEEGILNYSREAIHTSNEDELMNMYLELLKKDCFVNIGLSGFFCSAIYFLKEFAYEKLHVIDTFSMGVINVNEQLPLMLRVAKYNESIKVQETSYRLIDISMDNSTLIYNDVYPSIVESIESLSTVLNTVIPELKLEVSDHGVTLGKDNVEVRSIDIIASRDGVKIPLKYESDGIRRLISILSPMVGMYNDPSIMLAVDEIDSGIFEFLLGEILQIMASSSKGQLVFTSHNLRPLEVIPSKYLAFTTTNPKNRYTSIANRGNSNLRDTYFRNIVLGSKSDEIYRPTDQFEIEQAFLIAGE